VTYWNELWFLETGAPRLHKMLTEELQVLTFLAQETGESENKIGIPNDMCRDLLKSAIWLHVDTMKMLADMQKRRA
jgi:hypothetical protein